MNSIYCVFARSNSFISGGGRLVERGHENIDFCISEVTEVHLQPEHVTWVMKHFVHVPIYCPNGNNVGQIIYGDFAKQVLNIWITTREINFTHG